MPYVTRDQQLQHRINDPFSPFRRVDPNQKGIMSLSGGARLTDELLDGVHIPPRASVAKWRDENDVHGAMVLSDRFDSTRSLLGPQVLATRDDVRKLSHILVMEVDQLVLVTMHLLEVRARQVIYRGFTRRAHLTIDKYDGTLHVLHASSDGQGGIGLYLGDRSIPTASSDIDFPYMALCQVPIGHVQMSRPNYGIITYKCRRTRQIFYRMLDQHGAIGEEKELEAPASVGGVDMAINGDSVLYRIDAIAEGKLLTMAATSDDRGRTISVFAPVDLHGFKPDQHLPATAPVFQDYLGNFHIPVATLNADRRHFFDVMSDTAVEAMVLSDLGGSHTAVAFPKKPGLMAALGRGDGFTDGLGIIVTALDRGKLLVSNSQSGGIHYPPERLLNHEMPLGFAFKATECCYTRAQQPNLVSMDYVFVEADETGNPISRRLQIDTWDMPLPTPQLTARAQGATVTLDIKADAWFEVGKTMFSIDDPKIGIVSAHVTGDRTAEVTFSTNQLAGRAISFQMQNIFYWHAGEAVVQ